MTDTLKVVDAEALELAVTRWRYLNGRYPFNRQHFEEILADITTDDLSPAHRERVPAEGACWCAVHVQPLPDCGCLDTAATGTTIRQLREIIKNHSGNTLDKKGG